MTDVSLVPLPPVTVIAGVASLLVGTTEMSDKSMPSLYATDCATLVYRPCPISTPPAQKEASRGASLEDVG